MGKKILKSNKGMTLIEILICVAILAIVMPTMLSLFSNSSRFTKLTEEIMDVGYIAQKTIEETLAVSNNLYDIDNPQFSFLNLQHGRQEYVYNDAYEVSIKMIPTGFYSTKQDVAYLYIIGRLDDILVIGPDGTNNFQSTSLNPGGSVIAYPANNSDFVLTYTGNTTSIEVGGVLVQSNLPSSSTTLVVVVNIAGWNQPTSTLYNLVGVTDYSGANIEIVVCAAIPDINASGSADYDYTGINVSSTLPAVKEYRGVSNYDTTLIQVDVDVYDKNSPNGAEPLHTLIDRIVVNNE